ncbi:Sodium/alanine symporter [Moraxella catarrhalis]|nr:Sodium/alanine symporter [Moraxella catarrhalis]
MESMIDTLNGIIWSPALIYLCLAAGLFYSILTRFVQLRHFKEMIRLLFSGNQSPEGISSFRLTVFLALGLYFGCGWLPFWVLLLHIPNPP